MPLFMLDLDVDGRCSVMEREDVGRGLGWWLRLFTRLPPERVLLGPLAFHGSAYCFQLSASVQSSLLR